MKKRQCQRIYEVLIFSTTRSGGFMHEVLISLLARHRELIYEVCIFLRRAESPKRDQNLVNGVTLGETGADTKCDSLS